MVNSTDPLMAIDFDTPEVLTPGRLAREESKRFLLTQGVQVKDFMGRSPKMTAPYYFYAVC